MNSETGGLFEGLLLQIYSAEMQLARTLPSLRRQIVSGEMRVMLESILRRSQCQLDLLGAILDQLGIEDGSKDPWLGMSFLLLDAVELAEGAAPDERDTAVALALADVKHLQIGRYNAIYARTEGLQAPGPGIAEKLRASLIEEVEIVRHLASHTRLPLRATDPAATRH